MREIKFRGKMPNGAWVYGSFWDHPVYPDIIDEYSNYRLVDRDTIGQFTGLLDCNGKEIYEGDILFNSRERYVVKFKKEWAAYIAYGLDELDNGEKNFLLDEVVNTPIDRLKPKIIGNLYDNPELLEAQNARD